MLRAFIVVSILSLGPAAVADDAEDLFEAARKGDGATVKALIAKGVDVNAKWRYDTTALMMAARRGHADVVKLLLDSGANPNVKDSFYGMTPLGSAAGEGRAEIVAMLLDKGAQGIDGVLSAGVAQNKIEIVKLALAKGGMKPETLSTALGAAERNNRTEIAEALRAAGAVPPPKAEFSVDPETLRRYAGSYRDPQDNEFLVELRERKLFAGPPGQLLELGAFDAVTFRPLQFDGIRIVFQVEGTQVAGFTFKRGETTMLFKRVEGK